MTLDDKNTIDGASLLRSEDLAKPDEKDLKADCGTGKEKKKRACANCTCGLGTFEFSKEAFLYNEYFHQAS